MKRLLLSAAAMVLVAGSAAAQNQGDQHQDHQSGGWERGNHPAAKPQQNAPAARAPESRSFQGNRGPVQNFTPQFRGSDNRGPVQNFTPQSRGVDNRGPVERFAPSGSVAPRNSWQGRQGGDRHTVIGQDRWSQPQTPPSGSVYNPNNRTHRNGWNPNQSNGWSSGTHNGGTYVPQNGWTAGQRNGWNSGTHNGGTYVPQNGWATGRQNGWNQGGTGRHVWDRNGDQRRGWDRDGDNNWWRGHRGFDNYQGWREGFWFAPGWGYYRPDSNWYDYDWEVGVQVPYDLRGYYVSDPYDYGLPQAPYGCEWIFLGDQIVLIDLETGEILQIGDGY